MQNAAARMVLGKGKRASAKLALQELHWLNVEARIYFKVLLLVFKVIYRLCSDNLSLTFKGFNGRDDDYRRLETPIFKTVYGKRIYLHSMDHDCGILCL